MTRSTPIEGLIAPMSVSSRSLARLRLNSFAVLGRVGMDLYADPPGTRIEDARSFTTALGGSAGNIAVALARQGARAALISAVSDDAVGRYCLSELARYGVATNAVLPVGGGARNSLAVTETRAAGCQVVLYRNQAADFALSKAQIDTMDFTTAGALVVTGTALASEPSRSATRAAMTQARASGALVVLDIDYRAYSWASEKEAASVCEDAAWDSDIVIGNDDEFGVMAGSHSGGMAMAEELALGSAFVVYKKGAEGSVTFSNGTSFETPIYPVTALKPMGAGDGFMGGLLASLAAGHDLPQAVRRGSATAAMIVAGIGCAPASPDTAALDGFIAQY
jgi:5-dehydro-2-deoxygluconokinase